MTASLSSAMPSLGQPNAVSRVKLTLSIWLRRGAPCALGALACAAGTVAGPGITGRIAIDCTGAPLVAAQVEALSEGAGVHASMTDDQGRFLLAPLAEGSYTLRVTLPGFLAHEIQLPPLGRSLMELGTIDLGCDQIRLPGNSAGGAAPGSPETALVLDAREQMGSSSPVCVNDRVESDVSLHSTAVFPFSENLLPRSSCASGGAAIFSVDNAVEFVPDVSGWTAARGDILTLPMRPRIDVPLHVWIAVPAGSSAAVTATANTAVTEANQLYDVNRVGLRFVATIHPAGGGRSTIGSGCADAVSHGLAGTGAWHSPGALNVYYVSAVYLASGGVLVPAAGVSCGADWNILYVSSTLGNPTTLAHELGHALALRGFRGHTGWAVTVPPQGCVDVVPLQPGCQPATCPAVLAPDLRPGVPGCYKFTPANLMWPEVGGRSKFTLGQAFQMNLDAFSRLNANGLRAGLGVIAACDSLPWEHTSCPVLWLDS